MKTRTLALLAAATLFFALAALLVDSREAAYTHADGGALVFPDFAARINDAAKIVVETSSGKFTILRQGTDWVVADKYDFPAPYDVVKSTLVGLAQLRTIDAKTSQPELYPRLEVADPSAKGAKSAEITVEDGTGAVLARLILGKQREPRGSGGDAIEIYVRKPGDAQSWLATGTLQRNDDIRAWMQRTIVTLDPSRVHTVAVTPTPDEAKVELAKPEPAKPEPGKAGAGKMAAPIGDRAYVLSKNQPGDGDFTLEDVPPAYSVKPGLDANQIAGALATLIADDVLPAKDLKPEATLLRSLDYRSFDGAVIDLQLFQQGGKIWLKLNAGVDPKLAAVEKFSETAKDMTALDARVKDWVFALNGADLATLEKKFSDLVEPKDKGKPKS